MVLIVFTFPSSFRQHVLTDETTTFVPHPDDPQNKTLLTLEGSLAVNLWGVASAIEAAIVPAYIRLVTFFIFFDIVLFSSSSDLLIFWSFFSFFFSDRLTTKGREIERPLVAKLKALYTDKPIPQTRSEQKAAEISQVTESSFGMHFSLSSLVPWGNPHPLFFPPLISVSRKETVEDHYSQASESQDEGHFGESR